MNAAAMNDVWMKFFGTSAQPNKPARATIEAANLVKPGALVEIEFVAAKKVKAARSRAK
jgi:enamine deaminase RidA (YjgF/YER057c/UK114 family)